MNSPQYLTPFLDNPRDERITNYLKYGAAYELVFGRRSDNLKPDKFDWDVIFCEGNDVPDLPVLTKRDVIVITPQGNKWKESEGYASYFVIPFAAQGMIWVCIGKERIVSHASRGAYPLSHGYIFPFSLQSDLVATTGTINNLPIEALRQLVANLREERTALEYSVPSRGEFRRSPEESTILDKAMLEIAIRHYEKGRPFFLRTLLLEQSMHPRHLRETLLLDSPLKDLFGNTKSYLVGVPSRNKSRKSTSSLFKGGFLIFWIKHLQRLFRKYDLRGIRTDFSFCCYNN